MPMSHYRLLIVEDDRDLARNLVDFLELQGYTPDYVADGLSALTLLSRNPFDLLIVDISLPGLDGISLCRRYRNELGGMAPIVVLTAQDDLDTKLSAFDLGADDYVVKPVALRELEARVRALIRRSQPGAESKVLTVGDLRFDTGTMRIERAGMPISLPPVPTRILALLMRHAPNVVTQQAIFREIWGDEVGDKHAMLVHMHALRNAVDKPFSTQLVHTVRGFGYRLAADHAQL